MASPVERAPSLRSTTTSEEDRRFGADPGGLTGSELWWRHYSKWLEEAGYVLRPRYQRGWAPSWTGNKKLYFDYEDGQVGLVRHHFLRIFNVC